MSEEDTAEYTEHEALISPRRSEGHPHDGHHPHIPGTRHRNAVRRQRYALLFLFLNAMFQSFSAAGIIAILDLYMSDFMQFSDHTSNAISAAFIVVFSAIAPLGGYLSDKQLGNYKMQVICQFIWVAGQAMVMFFTVTAIDNAIGGVEGTATRVLVTIGLLIVAVGYGLIQPMQSVLVADQFNEEGEDNEKRRAASFSWYYFFQNAGNLGGESVNPQLRGTVSAFSAMLSITASLVVAFVFFVVGKPFFVVRLSDREADATGKVQRINEDKPIVPWWRQAKDWVHSADAKAIWKISKVYLILTAFWTVYNQQSNSWDQQGSDMNGEICFSADRCFTVSPDTMPSVNDLMDMVIIAVLEGFLFKWLTRYTGGHPLKPLPKIAFGMFFCTISCVCGGVLQIYMDMSEEGSVSLFWQLPQYFFISLAEILVCIPALEFAYEDSPPHLRSFVTSLWYISQALGNLFDVVLFLALAALQTWILFYLFTGIMLVASCYYCLHIHNYVYGHFTDPDFLVPVTSQASIAGTEEAV